MNVRRGYERSPRDGTNENKRARGECGEYKQAWEGSNERRGYERSPGDGTNETSKRASTRGGRGLNEHMGYERSTRDGTNEHDTSVGSTNERRRVQTSAGGYERA